jgi:hypothetical protein
LKGIAESVEHSWGSLGGGEETENFVEYAKDGFLGRVECGVGSQVFECEGFGVHAEDGPVGSLLGYVSEETSGGVCGDFVYFDGDAVPSCLQDLSCEEGLGPRAYVEAQRGFTLCGCDGLCVGPVSFGVSVHGVVYPVGVFGADRGCGGRADVWPA